MYNLKFRLSCVQGERVLVPAPPSKSKLPVARPPDPRDLKWHQWIACNKRRIMRTLKYKEQPKENPHDHPKAGVDPDLQSTFQRLYNEQEAAKKKHKSKLGITKHARFRFHERFDACGFTLEELIADATTWWHFIRAIKNDNFLVRWKLWKYVISRDFYIITMMPYGKNV